MLKRQRPVSPPIPSSSVPFVSDSPGDLIERHSKRRRTLPPVLDGASRGWAMTPQLNVDDEEDYYSDEDGQENVASDFQHSQQQLQSEYKSTNTMLRELHTLHQHRLLFSPHFPQDARASPTSINMSLNPKSYPQQQTPNKSLMSQHFERLQTPQYPTTPRIEKKSTHIDPLSEEVTRVTERYESTNRLLGSWFLSRRRALDSSDEVSGNA
ncbi:hypothetical protein CVT25_014945 [Psilocybe cyanescens]|uniref:Uncharacterized protein n=1 Tax=Psilocybe cyanescens TaxID=93625 RepID=A0A409XI43_PSICY|nr:hypothetical protein CVT25_014945 [Psilocybe cyanescens]